MRQFAQEYSIVHGLRAHLLRDREDAVQRFDFLCLFHIKINV